MPSNSLPAYSRKIKIKNHHRHKRKMTTFHTSQFDLSIKKINLEVAETTKVIIAGLTSSWREMSIGESGGQLAAGKRRTPAPQPSRFPATTRRRRAAPPRKPLFPFRRRLAVLLVFFLEEGSPFAVGRGWMGREAARDVSLASMDLEPTLETNSI